VKKIDTRFALWGTALLLLTLLPLFAGFAGTGWELSQMAGLLGCIGCVALCGAPLRPRNANPPTLLSLKAHTVIGWVSLSLVAIHVGGLILADRVVVEYLKPSAPLYQLAGITAAALLLMVVVSGIAAVRRRLFRSHRGFQATHVIGGCVLIALIAMHVIATDRYVGGRGRRALILAATMGGILMLLRPRRLAPGASTPGTSTAGASTAGASTAAAPFRQWVFGRHSRLILGVATLLAISLGGLIGAAAGAALREPVMSRSERMPLDFPHAAHVAVNCLVCHHNFADGRGMDTCVGCHRSSRADLKVGLQARFHGFCFECHRHPDPSFQKHGPVAGCVSCHHSPDSS
jgi:predicted CXXCH cytochrome family protein